MGKRWGGLAKCASCGGGANIGRVGSYMCVPGWSRVRALWVDARSRPGVLLRARCVRGRIAVDKDGRRSCGAAREDGWWCERGNRGVSAPVAPSGDRWHGGRPVAREGEESGTLWALVGW